MSYGAIKTLVRHNMVTGMKITNSAKQQCAACIEGRQMHTPIPADLHITADALGNMTCANA